MAKKMSEFEVLLEMAAKLDPSYRTAMENARKGVEDVGKGGKEGAEGIDVMDIALGNLVADGISSLISWAGDAARSLYDLADETREFRQDMASLETAFDDAGFSTVTATDYWKDMYAVLGEDDRAVEAANNISRMADTEEELADWLTITTGVLGAYQDALPVENLAETAAETAKVGKVTGALADALNWSSKAAEMFADYMSEDVTTAEDAFNEALAECSNEAERQALINETLLELYGDAATKYRETAESAMSANEATAELTLTQAEMGEKIEPVTSAVKEGMTDIYNAGMDLLSDVDFDAWAGKIETAFSWAVDTGLPFLIDNLPTIATLFGGVTAAILAQMAATKLKTVADLAAASGMTVMQYAQQGLNAAMKANVIGLIITGITLLISAFVYLWNNCEGFRNFWINMWAKIKTTAGSVANWFTGTFVPWISGIWAQISGSLKQWYETNLKPIIDGVIRYFRGIIDFIKGVFTGDWQLAWQGIVDIFGGIFDTLVAYAKVPINGIIALLNWFIGKINTIQIGPLPNWDILGQYAGAVIGFNIPTIPALAEGGIATSATLAMVGEGRESEAILPLSKLESLLSGDGESDENITIVFSPNITVMPGADAADVENAIAQAYEQFKAFMDRYLKERKRYSFA